MDEAKFWSLIDEARAAAATSPDPEDMLDALAERIEDLEDAEIASFHQLMQVQYWKTYTYDLAGALYIIKDGKSDEDDFHGFQGWLIAQGKAFFESAIADPDSLADADVIPDQVYLPDILTLASEAYREATGNEVPEDSKFTEPDDPAGQPLEVPDLPQRLPRLCREFVFFLDDEVNEDAGNFVEAPVEESAL